MAVNALSGLMALMAGFLVMILIIVVALWIYQSLAYKQLAIRTKTKNPNLAWIPGFGPIIIAYKISKMPSWPWFLLFGLLLLPIPIIGLLGVIPLLVFSVYNIIWMWKTLEAVGRPGWWVLLSFIPFVGGLIFLVLLGVAAWGKK